MGVLAGGAGWWCGSGQFIEAVTVVGEVQRDPVPEDVDRTNVPWMSAVLPVVRRLWKGLTQIPTVSQWILESGAEKNVGEPEPKENRGGKPEKEGKSGQPKQREAAAVPAKAVQLQAVKLELPVENPTMPIQKEKEPEPEAPGSELPVWGGNAGKRVCVCVRV